MASFISGSYTLIGTPEGQGESYLGKVELRQSDRGIQVTRRINGSTITGSGAIEQAGADNAPVLRIRFNERNHSYEETCLIGSDLNNYARITCHLYRPDVETDKPGLEALFYDQHD